MAITLGMNESLINKHNKKRLIQGAFLMLVIIVSWWTQNQPTKTTELQQAINNQSHDVVVEFNGVVKRLLQDDNQGSRHQKFIVSNGSNTILVAHNIDLAPRVPIQKNDQLRIRGEYIWNDQGGLIHWTHHDPQNKRLGGWIELNGKKFK